MGRKSIFDVISSKMDLENEAERIQMLYESECINFVNYVANEKHYVTHTITKKMTLSDFVDEYVFPKWKHRGRCISQYDLLIELGLNDLIDNGFKNVELLELLLYFEFISNMVYYSNKVEIEDIDLREYEKEETVNFRLLSENIESVLNYLNYEQKTIDEERVIIVEKNTATTSVCGIVDDSTALSVIQYNHFLLKGDIDKKRAILKELGDKLEPERPTLKQLENKKLEDNIFYLLNNLNIRHNNVTKDKPKYKEYVANMSDEELENWYDEIYQMILLAFLELDDFKERRKKINALKRKIEGESDNGKNKSTIC